MGDVWSVLFVLGLAMPGLLLVASTFVVFRLARRLRSLKSGTRPRWHFLLVHLGLGLGLTIPLGPLAALGWFVVPGYLYGEVRAAENPSDVGRSADPAISAVSGDRRWGLAALFTCTGLLLPWATGLGVKAYLDAQGAPTLPLEGFLDPASVVVELVLTLLAWGFPFVLVASAVVVPWRVGFPADSPLRASLLPIWLAYAAGVLAAIPVFAAVFWEFDTLMLLVPVGIVLLPPMGVGYLTGWWLLRRTGRVSLP